MTYFKGHTQQPLILNAVDEYDYIYIPKFLLADSVNGILYNDFLNRKTNPSKRQINIWWNSTCNDGSYVFIITPKQILFTSGHNNPNPNFLFWTVDIDSIQYKQIKNGLLHKSTKQFKNVSGNYFYEYSFYDKQFKDTFKIPGDWTEKILKQHDAYCEKQIKKQIAKYFATLNSFILNKKNNIRPLSEKQMKDIKPKYFSSFETELKAWVNHVY